MPRAAEARADLASAPSSAAARGPMRSCPRPVSKKLQAGELVMIGIAPKVKGYAGVVGDVLPVSGEYTPQQKECLKYLKEAFRLTKAQLLAGQNRPGDRRAGPGVFCTSTVFEISGLPVRAHHRPARGRVPLLRPEQPRCAQARHDGLRGRQFLRASRVQRRPDRNRL